MTKDDLTPSPERLSVIERNVRRIANSRSLVLGLSLTFFGLAFVGAIVMRIADPDNFLFVLLGCEAAQGGANRARWCHEPFDELLVQAKQTTDMAERTRLYEEAQLIFKEEAPWVTIAHSIVFKPLRKEVVDFKIDPFGGHIFYGVDLKE